MTLDIFSNSNNSIIFILCQVKIDSFLLFILLLILLSNQLSRFIGCNLSNWLRYWTDCRWSSFESWSHGNRVMASWTEVIYFFFTSVKWFFEDSFSVNLDSFGGFWVFLLLWAEFLPPTSIFLSYYSLMEENFLYILLLSLSYLCYSCCLLEIRIIIAKKEN